MQYNKSYDVKTCYDCPFLRQASDDMYDWECVAPGLIYETYIKDPAERPPKRCPLRKEMIEDTKFVKLVDK
jgi:hypothetical protein